MSRGKTVSRPPPIAVDPTRAVKDPASLPPAELIGELTERATYSDLDEPAEAFERALMALYAPGQLELGKSDGVPETLELLRTVIELRGWIAAVRRALEGDYSPLSASSASPAFLRATRLLGGLTVAKPLQPNVAWDPRSDAMENLRRVRVAATTTLVVAGSKSIQDSLARRLSERHGESAEEGTYLVETLQLFYTGISPKPYPLNAAEAASVTEWFPGDRTGVTARIPHEPALRESCPHCVADRPAAGTMRQRHRRLRLKLAELIWPGLSTVELGYSDDEDDVRRQAR
jgi:hypothetical protein